MILTEETVVLTRIFDAPRERVFDAWTRAEHLASWFGPKGFTVPACETDPRPGGIFRLCMRSPRGQDFWVRGEFREVVRPERLVITCTAEDDRGIPRLEEVINVAFEEQGGKTKLTLNTTARGPSAEAQPMLANMQKGWAQTVDRLGALFNPQFKGKAMQLQPYLFFDGRAEEAIEFYRKVLGAEVQMLVRFKDSPEPMGPTSPPGDKVMHASLRIGDTTLMASDGHCMGKPSFQGFSLSLTARNDADAERLFTVLSEGGKVQQPLIQTFFSSRFGMLADRFGVSWMIIVAP
jgi:PhnB protein